MSKATKTPTTAAADDNEAERRYLIAHLRSAREIATSINDNFLVYLIDMALEQGLVTGSATVEEPQPRRASH